MEINQIRPLESDFTEVLEKLVLNVEMLYYMGKLPKKGPTVAVVGARKNTPYGYEIAYNAAYAAAKSGAIVVSGLAYGCDSIAHRAALDAGGVTVAVLGTPIDRIYPKRHIGLAREIIEKGGAVISEYAPGVGAESGTEVAARFLARNRLIAGLSDVVLVAEAADRSGTLNTATHALNFGVNLMVAPGDITRESSKGCNKLLGQGAIPYTGPDDLLDMLFPERLRRFRGKNADLRRQEQAFMRLAGQLETEVERQIVAMILTGVQDGEEIVRKLGILATDFLQTVTILEVKGVVKPLGMNKWTVRG
ncbi:DNA-protecting protein DprA [Candidatus Saccharibacteria bacterium]|nr:DNA-protecting protein DprA [Candidatus Saccharibacteria bacterium]